MCGVVKRPTRRKNFDPNRFNQLSEAAVSAIVGVCEDTHIPSLATNLILAFVEKMATKPNLVMQNIPFALYQDGKRYVTEETLRVEESVMHLAMAGSVRHYINQELKSYDLFLEMGHCCDIQLHSVSLKEEALALSHDGNVYRADKLRTLTEADTCLISRQEFLDKVERPETKALASMMFDLVQEEIYVA